MHTTRFRAGAIIAAPALMLAAASAQATLLNYSFTTSPESSYTTHYAYTGTCRDSSGCSVNEYSQYLSEYGTTTIDGTFTLDTALMPANGYSPPYGYYYGNTGWLSTAFTVTGPEVYSRSTSGSSYAYLAFYDETDYDQFHLQDLTDDSNLGTTTYGQDGRPETYTYDYAFNLLYLYANTDQLEAGEVDGKFVPTAFDIDPFRGYAYTAAYKGTYDYLCDEFANYLGYNYSYDYKYSYAYLTGITAHGEPNKVPSPGA